MTRAGIRWETSQVPLLIVGCERTGSNLVRHTLGYADHVDIGGELLNLAEIEQDRIDWNTLTDSLRAEEWSELLRLRRAEPVGFLQQCLDRVASPKIIGFKLFYGHAKAYPDALRALSEMEELRVLHLRRRNLLLRHLSNERAERSGTWYVPRRTTPEPPAPIHLDFRRVIDDFLDVDEGYKHFRLCLSEREYYTEVFYEDLAANPHETLQHICDQLDLEIDVAGLQIASARMGGDSIHDAIENLDDFMVLVEWASFVTDTTETPG